MPPVRASSDQSNLDSEFALPNTFFLSPSQQASRLELATAIVDFAAFHGGRDRDRTCDPFRVKEVLYR
jgi:hypothetical protein